MGQRPQLYYAAAWKNPVGGTASDTWLVELQGYAKLNSQASPYCVANEFVASRIGQILGLPLPPGAAIQGPEDRGPAWVSLTFSKTGERLPPIDPPTVGTAVPDLAAGVVVFDVLIGNYDRHAGNLAYLPSSKRLEIFDHSHCLLGTAANMASYHLTALRDKFLIDGRGLNGGPLGNRHCLLDLLTRASDVLDWADRISSLVGDRTIGRLCVEVRELDLGVTENDAERLKIFLTDRRDNIRRLIRENEAEFTRIPKEQWVLA